MNDRSELEELERRNKVENNNVRGNMLVQLFWA